MVSECGINHTLILRELMAARFLDCHSTGSTMKSVLFLLLVSVLVASAAAFTPNLFGVRPAQNR